MPTGEELGDFCAHFCSSTLARGRWEVVCSDRGRHDSVREGEKTVMLMVLMIYLCRGYGGVGLRDC
jgi:hypothetical protein